MASLDVVAPKMYKAQKLQQNKWSPFFLPFKAKGGMHPLLKFKLVSNLLIQIHNDFLKFLFFNNKQQKE